MIDSLITKIIKMQNPTCVGLDTDFSYLPQDMQDVLDRFERVKKERSG